MSHEVRHFLKSKVTPPFSEEKRVADEFLTRSDSPLDLEIGCGVGWHPIRYALANPERRLIAIEHTREKFESFERRFQNHASPENLLPVHADAVRWIAHSLAPASVDRVFLLYPNPEPKSASKRWLRMPFFSCLLETLKPGGTIQLATNIESYLDEAVTYASEAWGLSVGATIKLAARDALIAPRTHFEKKYLERGETCFDVTFTKV